MTLSLKDATRWLESIPLQTEVDMDPVLGQEIMSLFGHKGFEYVLGLLLAEKQGLLIQLSNLNLGDQGQRNIASVTQGQIKGLDRLRQTLLEIVSHSEAQNPAESKEKVNA